MFHFLQSYELVLEELICDQYRPGECLLYKLRYIMIFEKVNLSVYVVANKNLWKLCPLRELLIWWIPAPVQRIISIKMFNSVASGVSLGHFSSITSAPSGSSYISGLRIQKWLWKTSGEYCAKLSHFRTYISCLNKCDLCGNCVPSSYSKAFHLAHISRARWDLSPHKLVLNGHQVILLTSPLKLVLNGYHSTLYYEHA